MAEAGDAKISKKSVSWFSFRAVAGVYPRLIRSQVLTYKRTCSGCSELKRRLKAEKKAAEKAQKEEERKVRTVVVLNCLRGRLIGRSLFCSL